MTSRIPKIEAGFARMCPEPMRTRVAMEWFLDAQIKCYLGGGTKTFGRTRFGSALVIGSFEVVDPSNYGKGLKTELLDAAQAFVRNRPDIEAVYCANVNNPALIPGLLRRGFMPKDLDVFPNGVGADYVLLVHEEANVFEVAPGLRYLAGIEAGTRADSHWEFSEIVLVEPPEATPGVEVFYQRGDEDPLPFYPDRVRLLLRV